MISLCKLHLRGKTQTLPTAHLVGLCVRGTRNADLTTPTPDFLVIQYLIRPRIDMDASLRSLDSHRQLNSRLPELTTSG